MPNPMHRALLLLALTGACSPAPVDDGPAAVTAPGSGPHAPAPPAEDSDGDHGGGWRLAREDSPYLRQHADNPVTWYPWGEEAFALAREQDKPVFLSIGYSSCHWCHVMEHESFEDAATAAYLNEHYVCIKVDREQRPDVDARYMRAVQAMGQSGGWPLSVWLTPDGKAFWGATYLPPRAMGGMPSFMDVLAGMVEAWGAEREAIQQTVDRNTALLLADHLPDPVGFDAHLLLGDTTAALVALLDPVLGGVQRSGPNRFPPSILLRHLLRRHLRDPSLELDAVVTTLDAMAAGGLHDHVGGGFHRYSTDPRWFVPHFEKMLYDNALLAATYAEAFAVTGAQRFARTTRRTLHWLTTDMRSPEGLYFAARDADSLPYDAERRPRGQHAEEGDVYGWTPATLSAALGATDAAAAATLFGVTEGGSFERGLSILALDGTLDELAAAPPEGVPAGEAFLPWYDDVLARLAEHRAGRPQAFRDEKCLTAWNGLALTGFARAARLLDDEALRAETASLADAIAEHLLGRDDHNGLIVHHQRFEGRSSGAGDLDDHAYLARGLLDAYEATGEAGLLGLAWELTARMRERFEDGERGGFFTTAGDDPLLPGRTRLPYDGARPAGQSVALGVLARLAPLDDSGALQAGLDRAVERLAGRAAQAPEAFASTLTVIDAWQGPLAEVVLDGSGPAHADLLAEARRSFLPAELLIADADEAAAAWMRVATHGLGQPPSLLAGKRAEEGSATAWVCKRGVCLLPVHTPEALAAGWDFVRRAGP